MKKPITRFVFCFLFFFIVFFILSEQIMAQEVSIGSNPTEISFPPSLLVGRENVKYIEQTEHIKSWTMPINDDILRLLKDFLERDPGSNSTTQAIQTVQPAYDLSKELSITVSAPSSYTTSIQITSPTTNQTITFPDSSGEVSLLGQTISGSEILNDTIELGTKTTGDFLSKLESGNGIGILGDTGEGWTATAKLSDLTENWTQSGPYDIVLNNPASELKILDSDGTSYAIFDVGDLSSDVTYTLSGATGTLLTSSNYGSFISGAGDLLAINNLSDLNDVSTARTNLGLGDIAVESISNFLQVTNNLSDLNNTTTARSNLGLGTAALQVSSFFLQTANDFSDLNNASTARSNLGLGSAALQSTTAFLQSVNNLSDLNDATSGRTNLGLGTIATQSAGNVFLTGGALNGTTIGDTTPDSGSFTIVNSSGDTNLASSGNLILGNSSGTISIEGDATVATGSSLVVNSADSLTVGGNIIPQTVTVVVDLIATSILGLGDKYVFIADNDYKLTTMACIYSGASLSGSVMATVDTGTQAPGAGTDQLSSSIDLSGTTNTLLTGTLITSPTTLSEGDRLGFDFSGTLTGIIGTCTLTLKRT